MIVPLAPGRVDQMSGGGDLSSVIEFIQKVRQVKPRIGTEELVKLVEERFPHICIEMDGQMPRIELG
jgi:hypothetical protein